ncbi:MAG: hypothetical protein ABJA82_06205 [Myxococcales bacterium]
MRTRSLARATAIALAVATSPAASCGGLEGLGGPVPPLASFQVTASGDLTPLRPPGDGGEMSLRVALVWGDQWLTEPFCIVPPESDAAAAVIAAGCRDPFGFVAARVAANTPITLGTPTTITLGDLPSADVLVGSVTSRVAYGSIVLYDDRDFDGTLGIGQPHHTTSGRGGGPGTFNGVDSLDIVYGASFVTMTAPDQRIAYREGAFDSTTAFYPRSGCGPPLPGFSVLAAGGFSVAAGLTSAVTGQPPAEVPTTCAESAPADAVIAITPQAPLDVQEVACSERAADSSVRYREPPEAAPNLTDRMTACVHLPTFEAGNQSNLIELVVSGRPQDRCKGLTHYTLRGCRENVACTVPDWDFTAHPPPWWPCPR